MRNIKRKGFISIEIVVIASVVLIGGLAGTSAFLKNGQNAQGQSAAAMNNTIDMIGEEFDFDVSGSGILPIATGDAMVGGVSYDTLQEAVDEAQNGATIKVARDVILTSTIKVPRNKTLTFDLNGKTIDGTDNVRIAIMSYGNLTIQDTSGGTGLIKAGIGTAGNAINICAGKFILNSGNIYSLNNGILIDEEATEIIINGGTITAEPGTNSSAAFYIPTSDETTVTINGGKIVGYIGIRIWNNTTLNIMGGEIDAQGGSGIQGNGTSDNTEIKISGNASIKGKETAIYHPQGGKLEISGNAALTGATGLAIKEGNILISGGTISGTGAATAYKPLGSGFASTSDGLYVEHYDNSTGTSGYGTPTVKVTGGTFKSTNGKAIASYVNPTGGIEAITGFVYGGTLSGTIQEELCAQGHSIKNNGDGTYRVE